MYIQGVFNHTLPLFLAVYQQQLTDFFLCRVCYDKIHNFEKELCSGGEQSSGNFKIPSRIFKFGKQENTLQQNKMKIK